MRRSVGSTVRSLTAAIVVTVATVIGLRSQSPSLPDRTVLPIPAVPYKGKLTPDVGMSERQPRPAVTAPPGAPNVVIILLDDAGYGQTSTFGGLVPTPTLDRLATNGLRFTRFHVTALCSPSRAGAVDRAQQSHGGHGHDHQLVGRLSGI